jgi:hypothetical protein
MKAFIDYSPPDVHFWREYGQLWERSAEKSPFQAPQVLQYFVKTVNDPIAIFKFYIGDKLKGAALFHKKGTTYSFLSDIKTDHNSFVISKDCHPEEVTSFFNCLHEAVRREKWTLVLNNQPMWVPYMDVFAESGRASGLFWLSAKSSVCPMVKFDTPENLYERLSKSRNNRYKLNRLQREHTVEFEANEMEEGLEEWANNFCDCHIARWKGTATPSKYFDPERRVFLLNCLKAWHRDGILVRFSLKADGKRIAFIIGLLQEKSLIYHNLTHDPDYNKHSPSLVLVILLGEWMRARGFNTLDFGDGNESYKYNFANEEGQLNSIFISSKNNLPFIIRANFISKVRSSPFLIQLYRQKMRPLSRLFFASF